MRLSASQLWQICSVSGIEISEVFAGLPTRIFKTREDYERFEDLKRHAEATPRQHEARAGVDGIQGMGEPSWDTALESAPRADVGDLAKVARGLSAEDVEFLIRSARGLRR